MPLSVKDIPYYKSLKANYDPKLARKSSGDLMQYMNGEILANNYLPEVMYYCMEALASVSLRGMKMNDVESQCQLLDHNVCGSLKSVLDRMGAAHPDIAQWGLQSIRNMAWGSTDFSDVIIESNLGATVVDMVTAHPGNKEIRLVGTQALAFLAFGTVDHSYSLAATGTLECVGKTEIIKISLLDETTYETAMAMCMVIKSLSLATHGNRILDSGVIDFVTIHLEDRIGIRDPLRAAAIKAISALASVNFACRESIGHTKVLKLIVDALSVDSADQNSLLVEEVVDSCEAMMHLSLNTAIAERLVGFHALAQVLNVLESTLIGEEYGAEVGSMILLNFVRFGSTANGCRRTLVSMIPRSINILDRVCQSTLAGYRARDTARTLLRIIADERDILRETLVPPSVMMGLVNASSVGPHTVPLLAELRVYNDGTLICSDDDVGGRDGGRGAGCGDGNQDSQGMTHSHSGVLML